MQMHSFDETESVINVPRRLDAGEVRDHGRRSFIGKLWKLAAAVGVTSSGASAFDSLWTTYQTPQAFIAETFGGSPPPPGSASGPKGVIHYWRAGGRTAWILDDLGKEGYQLTTAGFVVKDGAIEVAKVLIYRESRGEQVGQPAFLQKFTGAKLAGGQLDRQIDNISGATLSVQMMQRMARTVLSLNATVT